MLDDWPQRLAAAFNPRKKLDSRKCFTIPEEDFTRIDSEKYLGKIDVYANLPNQRINEYIEHLSKHSSPIYTQNTS